MEYRGVIRGFGTYTEAQIEQMKKDLGIAMPTLLLQYCASYYQSIKRDPGIEELKLWDRFSAVLAHTPHAVAPMELFTNDAFVAETYADMMEKRRALYPNAQTTPCTVAEASRIATAYLARVGKDLSLHGITAITEKNTPISAFSGESCVMAPGSSVQFRLLPGNGKQPQDGDWLVLLTSAEKQSREQYQLAVSAFLERNEITADLIAARSVDKSGLLHAVLSVTGGVWLELSRLSRVEEPIPLRLLTEGYEGDRLIRVPGNAASMVVEVARACGIRACVFGRATEDQKLRITNHHTPEILVEIRFARSLFPLQGVRVSLADEGDSDCLQISLDSKSTKYSYLCSDRDTTDEGMRALGLMHAAASASSSESPFLHAVYTSLASVLSLAVSGCDHTGQRLAVSFGYPKDMMNQGRVDQLLSAVLGVYRVQTELGIPTAAVPVLHATDTSTTEISVISLASGEACPQHFMRDGSRVYLMPVEMLPNGLPSFSNLRKDLEFVADLRRRGVLYSARVLCGESLTDGLRAMTQNGLTCRIRNSKLVSEGTQSLALLLETGVGIPAIPVGGVVTEANENVPQEPPQELPARIASLVWSETPEIVILSAPKDHEARRLAAALLKKGANVHCFESHAAEAYRLSRTILGAQTLILCGNARIPKTPQVLFAVETLKNAGGYVISVGENGDKNQPLFFPKGLSEENLTQICNF